MTIDLRRTRPRNESIVWVILGFGVAVILTGALLVTVQPSWFVDFDADISSWAVGLTEGSWHEAWWQFLSTVFAPWPLRMVLVVIAGFALYRQETLIAAWLLISIVVQFVLNALAKTVHARPRPLDQLVSADGYSFPSGHASAAAMVATAFILLTLVLMPRGRWLRRGLLVLWFFVAIAVGASRVFLGVHYPSDVIVGLALGAITAFVPWLVLTHRSEIVAVIPSSLGGHRTVAVIYNPSKMSDVAEFKQRVLEVSERNGYGKPLWFETTIEDPGPGQTRRALSVNPQLILAAGGDGTVRMVCGEAARSGVPVGVLPIGTGNLLARNLDLSLNLTEALEIAFTGTTRAIDLVSFHAETTDGDHDSVFLVMAGLGMDAAIMTGVRDDLKERVGFLAYFVSGAKALSYPLTKVTITVDDKKPRTFKARTVVVGNVGSLPGGITLIPDAEIDDGVLDVIVLAPRRFAGWLFIVWRVITRQKRTNDRLERMSGKHITITTERPTPMQLDGDPAGEGTLIEATAAARVLLIRVPK